MHTCAEERKGERKSKGRGLQTSVVNRTAFWEPIQPRLLSFSAHGPLWLATVKVIFFFFLQHTRRDAYTGAHLHRHARTQQWNWNVTVVIVILMYRNKPMSCLFTTVHTNTVTQASYKAAKKNVTQFVTTNKFGPCPKLKGNDLHKVISHQWKG